MGRDRRADLLLSGSDDPPPAPALGRLGSATAAALSVQLLLAGAVVADRRDRPTAPSAPAEPRRARPTPTPSPRVPVFGELAAARRRAALGTAKFAASQVCRDNSRFHYAIVESTPDLIESVVDARDPQAPAGSGIVVKVTLLPRGGLAYLVLSESGDCDA